MANEKLFFAVRIFAIGIITLLVLSSGCLNNNPQSVDELKAKCSDYLAGKGSRDIQMDALCDKYTTTTTSVQNSQSDGTQKETGVPAETAIVTPAPTATVAQTSVGTPGFNDAGVNYRLIDDRDWARYPTTDMQLLNFGRKGGNVFFEVQMTDKINPDALPAMNIDFGVHPYPDDYQYRISFDGKKITVFDRDIVWDVKNPQWGDLRETAAFPASYTTDGNRTIKIEVEDLYAAIIKTPYWSSYIDSRAGSAVGLRVTDDHEGGLGGMLADVDFAEEYIRNTNRY